MVLRLTFTLHIFIISLQVSQWLNLSVIYCCNFGILGLISCFCSVYPQFLGVECVLFRLRQVRRKCLPTRCSRCGMSSPLISKTFGRRKTNWCYRNGKDWCKICFAVLSCVLSLSYSMKATLSLGIVIQCMFWPSRDLPQNDCTCQNDMSTALLYPPALEHNEHTVSHSPSSTLPWQAKWSHLSA